MVSVQTHMRSTATGVGTVDFRNPTDREHARRIGRAWIELRRGAAASALRAYLFGTEFTRESAEAALRIAAGAADAAAIIAEPQTIISDFEEEALPQ